MNEKLPKVLADYFTATNAHDVGAMISVFTEDAFVHDDREDHRGAAAIRQWMEDTIAKYDYRVEVLDHSSSGSKATVRVSGSGTFPGSPITFTYDFTLAGDKVARMEIR